jgi:hypothetical protein
MKFIENFNLNIIGERHNNFRMRKSKKKTNSANKKKIIAGFQKA